MPEVKVKTEKKSEVIPILKTMDQMDMSKIDAEKKVERILKFVKRRSRARKEPDIVGIVEDFHKQYQMLYAQYDNLKRDPGRRASLDKGNESCSYGGSDSEYYSSEDVEANTALSNNRTSFRRMATDLEFELRKTYAEVVDLRHQLACRKKEKDALDLNHRDALSKIQEIEIMNADLRNQMDEKDKRLFALGTMHTGRVAELEEQLAGLKTELESEQKEKRELEAQLNEHMKHIKGNENPEFDILLDRKSKKISQYLIQVKTLKEELARKNAAERIMADEKEGLQVQVMELESEIDAVHKQKTKSEDEVKSSIREINDLREEKGKLSARIQELELSPLRDQEDSKSKRKNEAAQMKVHVDRLQPKLDSMNMEKTTDPKRTKKERADGTNKTMPPKTKMVRRLSLNNLNHYQLVKKMEDLAQEFDKKTEDTIRILSQRIKVAEKMHHENTEIYKVTKEKLEQENESLKQKAATYEAELKKLKDTMEWEKNTMSGFNSLAYKLEDDKNILTPMSNITDDECDTIMETGIERGKSNVDRLVAEIFKENEKAILREKVMNLEAKLNEVGEEKLKVLKAMIELEKKMREMFKENEEKVMNLKAKLSEETEEKLKALNGMSELEKKVRELEKSNKEKDEILLDREEGKREAIRQLCVLIDYHRSSCDHLKQSISSLTTHRIKNKT